MTLHAVILAGGSGQRLWPLSRELCPKQTLSVFGGVSLITRAVNRIRPFVELDGVHVVTGEQLFDELRNHLKAQPDLVELDIEYLVEPSSRNTAPAIALAAASIASADPEATIIMLPSDHLLEEGEAWVRTIRAAQALAEEGELVTIGLRPSTPETGYGYIRAGEEVLAPTPLHGEGRRVVEFVEKPDIALAKRFVEAGDHLWNSGMLVAKARTILVELRGAGERALTAESSHGDRIARTAIRIAAMPPDQRLGNAARAAFDALPTVPFDKAVLEVSDHVSVIPTDLDWSDVGSLLAIEKLGKPDVRGNVLVGRAFDIGSKDVLAYSPDRLVATLGLDNVIVVDTADATLVAARDRAQDVRLVVEALKAAGAPEVVDSRSSLRPWGSWTLLMKCDEFQIKSIDVNPGARLSLQSHSHRSEHWIVIAGRAVIRRDYSEITLVANQSVYLPAGTIHRMENPGPEPLQVIEVAVGDYLGEDDIVRFEDDFGRQAGITPPSDVPMYASTAYGYEA